MTQTKEFPRILFVLGHKNIDTFVEEMFRCKALINTTIPVKLVEFLDGAESAGSDLELDDGAGPVRQVRVAVQERADIGRDGVARTKDPGKVISLPLEEYNEMIPKCLALAFQLHSCLISTISPQAENISATPSIVGLSRGRFTATTVLFDRRVDIKAELYLDTMQRW